MNGEFSRSAMVYIPDETSGREKLECWKSGMIRKGVCISSHNGKVCLIKDKHVVLERESSGTDENSENYYYSIKRTIKGYYVVIYEGVHRTIRPGRDDWYSPVVGYEVFDENVVLVDEWTKEQVGIDEYPIELGNGMVYYNTCVYELETLTPQFSIPEKFEIIEPFSKDGYLKLNVLGDKRLFYVNVIGKKIVSQYTEEKYDVEVKHLEELENQYYKSLNPIKNAFLPSKKELEKHLAQYGNKIKSDSLRDFYEINVGNFPFLEEEIDSYTFLKLEDIKELSTSTVNKIKFLHSALQNYYLQTPDNVFFVFRYSNGIYCQIYNDFVKLFKEPNQSRVLFFNLDGKLLSKELYLVEFDKIQKNSYVFYKRFFKATLKMYSPQLLLEINSHEIKETKASIEFGRGYFHDPFFTGDDNIRPDCFGFSGEKFAVDTIDNSDLRGLIAIKGENLERVCKFRDQVKNSKIVGRFYYGIFCKTYKEYFALVKQMPIETQWQIKFYNYYGKSLHDDVYIINGEYFIKKAISYESSKFVLQKECGDMVRLQITEDGIKEEMCNEGTIPAAINKGISISDCKIEAIIDGYLYSLNHEFEKDYRYMPANEEVLRHKCLSIGIRPDSVKQCISQVKLLHENRPNFITTVEFVKKYNTNQGEVSVYKMLCEPKAYCNINGDLYYDFNVDEVKL